MTNFNDRRKDTTYFLFDSKAPRFKNGKFEVRYEYH